jgi:GxxExxY protein
MDEDQIARIVVDAAFKVHTKLGPGLLESVYEEVLAYELIRRQLKVERQNPLPVVYETVRLELGYRIDMLVEDRVILELKSVEVIAAVHTKQLLTYLRLADKRFGLLINFGEVQIKHGIKRIVNGLPY